MGQQWAKEGEQKRVVPTPKDGMGEAVLENVKKDQGILKNTAVVSGQASVLHQTTKKNSDLWPLVVVFAVLGLIAGFLITWGISSLIGVYRQDIFWDFFSYGCLMAVILLFVRIITWIREHDDPPHGKIPDNRGSARP
ncbi:MAG: hypothetical protein RBG13Loki_3675 [Promethearchaeota archaeon CR_4]|nr:MAG: hypothetical protein RBG13Loki_3675 [Candidatus Lokiarchaeota archaeon CR_4]